MRLENKSLAKTSWLINQTNEIPMGFYVRLENGKLKIIQLLYVCECMRAIVRIETVVTCNNQNEWRAVVSR